MGRKAFRPGRKGERALTHQQGGRHNPEIPTPPLNTHTVKRAGLKWVNVSGCVGGRGPARGLNSNLFSTWRLANVRVDRDEIGNCKWIGGKSVGAGAMSSPTWKRHLHKSSCKVILLLLLAWNAEKNKLVHQPLTQNPTATPLQKTLTHDIYPGNLTRTLSPGARFHPSNSISSRSEDFVPPTQLGHEGLEAALIIPRVYVLQFHNISYHSHQPWKEQLICHFIDSRVIEDINQGCIYVT